MSDATRAIALTEAVKVTTAAGGTADDALATAEKFHTFMQGDTAPVAAPKPAAPKPAAKPAAAKPKQTEEQAVAAATAVSEPEGEPEGEQIDEPTTVGGAVEQLLKRNLRPAALTLLKKFKATSVSGVKPADAEKFIAEAIVILAEAALTA